MSARFKVIVPVQAPALAMPRSGLAQHVRTQLGLAFAADTLIVLRRCAAIKDIVVASPDGTLAELANSHGAVFVHTPPRLPLNATVDYAFTQTHRPTDQMVAAMVSDLPALQVHEMQEVLAAIGRRFDTVYATDLGNVGVTFHAERASTFKACLAVDAAERQLPRGNALKSLVPGLRCDVDTYWGLRVATYIGVGEATIRTLRGLDVPRPVLTSA